MTGGRWGDNNPSVACGDSSPFRGAMGAPGRLPFQGRCGRTDMPPLKGEVPAKRAEGFIPRRIREVQSMLPEFVDRTGGSEWVSARPTGSKWVSARPTGSK